MRLKFSIALLAAFLFAGMAAAQGHQATLTWQTPSDVTAGSTYNVYRASGVCPATAPGTLTWTKLGTVSALTLVDTTITVGAWCYYVVQVQNSIESAPSIPGGGTAQPNTVTITIVIK